MTSHQLTPPRTDMMSVSSAIDIDPKNVLKSSTWGSSSSAFPMWSATPCTKITEKMKTNMSKIRTAQKNGPAETRMASSISRSLWNHAAAPRKRLKMRKDLKMRKTRRVRMCFMFVLMDTIVMSMREERTRAASKAFHFQSGPIRSRPSKARIRTSNSAVKAMVKKASTQLTHSGSVFRTVPSTRWSNSVMAVFMVRSLDTPINIAFEMISAITEN
mmetsp:Transcript_48791/g.129322  ORF Transcript_48791/g.129322 Transcript_48791/m.129322 type:complete len:216 (-) Transcript_48791:756-1403(-)